MRIEDYQALAMRTSPKGHDRVLNGCLGLIGESGEIVDVVKKWKFQSGENAELPKDKLIDECGDVLWYCAELCQGFGASLACIIERYSRTTFFSIPSVIRSACSLAMSCRRPYQYLDTNNDRESDNTLNYLQASSSQRNLCLHSIGDIVSVVRYILSHFCHTTLENAMERNIEKLKKRYPDGFDPERSLHRPEYESAEQEKNEETQPSRFLFEMRNHPI